MPGERMGRSGGLGKEASLLLAIIFFSWREMRKAPIKNAKTHTF
jgi:hypothetical protein